VSINCKFFVHIKELSSSDIPQWRFLNTGSKKNTLEMAELPVGILIVLCDYAFSEICSMCSDNNFDVLEIYFDGNNSLVFIMFLKWKQLNIFVKIMYLNSESIFYQCDREQGKELHMYQCYNISPGSSCHVKQFCLCILTWLNVGFIGLICDSVTTLSIVFIVNLCSTTIMTMRPHLVHDQRICFQFP